MQSAVAASVVVALAWGTPAGGAVYETLWLTPAEDPPARSSIMHSVTAEDLKRFTADGDDPPSRDWWRSTVWAQEGAIKPAPYPWALGEETKVE